MRVFYHLLNLRLPIVLLFLVQLSAQAQSTRKPDVIFLRDETKLEVLIQEVEEQAVKYKKVNDQEGPLFTVKKSEIVSIHYGNGEVETFEAVLEVPNYYAPSQQKQQHSPANNRAPVARTPREQFAEELRTSSADHLRATYQYYKTKSKTGLIMGIAGTSVGVLFVGIGAGIIAGAVDANGNFATQADERRAIRGVWMMTGGFAGGATLGTIGFVKAGRNGSKATRIRRELNHRGEPLAFRISPGFSPATGAGYLTLNIRF